MKNFEFPEKYSGWKKLSQTQEKILKYYENIFKECRKNRESFLDFYKNKTFFKSKFKTLEKNPIYLYLFAKESIQENIDKTLIIHEYKKDGEEIIRKNFFSKVTQKVILDKIQNYTQVLEVLNEIEKLSQPIRGKNKNNFVEINNDFLWDLHNNFVNIFSEKQLNKILTRIIEIENEQKRKMAIWNSFGRIKGKKNRR